MAAIFAIPQRNGVSPPIRPTRGHRAGFLERGVIKNSPKAAIPRASTARYRLSAGTSQAPLGCIQHRDRNSLTGARSVKNILTQHRSGKKSWENHSPANHGARPICQLVAQGAGVLPATTHITALCHHKWRPRRPPSSTGHQDRARGALEINNSTDAGKVPTTARCVCQRTC